MKKLIVLGIAAILFASCESNLDISSVALKKRLVVNALLNDKDQLRIWVSQSTDISDSLKPGPLQGALVNVTDEAGNIIVCTYNSVSEYYESTAVLTSGKTYLITVRANNFPDAFASVSLPAAASHKKSEWKDSTSYDGDGFPLGTITVHIDDNAATLNHYRLTIYYYDDLIAEWKSLSPETTDADIESRSIKTDDGGIIFSDQGFNGKSRDIGFITPFGFAGQSPKFLIVNENLSEDYYKYFKSLNDYRNSGGFFQEPSGVYTNIRNGLGIAAGSSIQRDTIQ